MTYTNATVHDRTFHHQQNKNPAGKKTVFLTIPSHFAGVSLFGFLVFATLLTGDGDVGSGFGTFALGLGDNENAEHYNFWYLFRYNYMHYVFWCFLFIYIYIRIHSSLFIDFWVHLYLIYIHAEDHSMLWFDSFLSLASGITLMKCEHFFPEIWQMNKMTI